MPVPVVVAVIAGGVCAHASYRFHGIGVQYTSQHFLTESEVKSLVRDFLQDLHLIIVSHCTRHLFIRHTFPIFGLSPQVRNDSRFD